MAIYCFPWNSSFRRNVFNLVRTSRCSFNPCIRLALDWPGPSLILALAHLIYTVYWDPPCHPGYTPAPALVATPVTAVSGAGTGMGHEAQKGAILRHTLVTPPGVYLRLRPFDPIIRASLIASRRGIYGTRNYER